MATIEEHLERVRKEREEAFDRAAGRVREVYTLAHSARWMIGPGAAIAIHVGNAVEADLELLLPREVPSCGARPASLFGFPVFVDLDDPGGMEVRATWTVS